MKKHIIGIGVAIAMFTLTAIAAEPASFYNAGEVGLSLSSGYDVGQAGELNGETLFGDDYNFNLSAGVFYFPWRLVGFEASVPFYNTTGVSVDEVRAGMLFRLPLSTSVPVLKSLAPYIGVGGVYNWTDLEDWAYVGKVGLEFRPNKKWGIFAEGQYRNSDFEWADGAVSIQGGLKLVL